MLSRPIATGTDLRPLWLALAAPGLIALAWEPARWLWNTWHAPAYDSHGGLVALAVAGLLTLSLLSGRAAPDPRSTRMAWALLALAAGVRLAGRVLDVNTIGALALVVDVGALASLLRVKARPFALHPALVAALFTMALPIEHYAQRLLGHPLQLTAAGVAHGLLSPFFDALERQGVLLLHPDVVLAIDLPCSGARGLSLYSSTALFLWTFHRLAGLTPVRLAAAVFAGALLANTLRILALFLGAMNGIAVASEPWHSTVGAAALAFGVVPVVAVFRTAARRSARLPRSLATQPGRVPSLGWPGALATSVLGIAIALAPQHPVDVAPVARDARLPTTLGPYAGVDVPLAEDEKAYFEQWGGGADKRHYRAGSGAEHTALLVRTHSPLRHLHGPDQCLIGSGHQVTRIGVVPGALPTVVYKSVAPDGRAWRVEASFASDEGEYASSVSEVVWRWLARPDTAWNLIERISPWDACAEAPELCARFDRALFISLDLPVETRERRTS